LEAKQVLTERLALLRKGKNLTQQDIAEAIGVTRPAYTAYESGSRKPEYDTLNKIADYYGVSIDFLLGRTSVPYMEGKQVGAVMDGRSDNLSEEEAEFLKISLETFRAYQKAKKKNQ
jgi:transcriptional regulator with XRE-family HTH domain